VPERGNVSRRENYTLNRRKSSGKKAGCTYLLDRRSGRNYWVIDRSTFLWAQRKVAEKKRFGIVTNAPTPTDTAVNFPRAFFTEHVNVPVIPHPHAFPTRAESNPSVGASRPSSPTIPNPAHNDVRFGNEISTNPVKTR
jgi:hypothetical protein